LIISPSIARATNGLFLAPYLVIIIALLVLKAFLFLAVTLTIYQKLMIFFAFIEAIIIILAKWISFIYLNYRI
jgi:hypothetical protein